MSNTNLEAMAESLTNIIKKEEKIIKSGDTVKEAKEMRVRYNFDTIQIKIDFRLLYVEEESHFKSKSFRV